VIAEQASARAREGLPVYPFHLGEPDFATPAAITSATISALEAGHTHYPPNAGEPTLRDAIAADLACRYGTDLTRDEIIVTVGACEAVSLALIACLEPGDDVLLPTPCWPNYLQTPGLIGAAARQVALSATDGYRLDVGRLLGAAGPRTKAVLLSTPSNPTGATVDPTTLRALLDAVRARGMWLIVDEIYHDIVFVDGWRGILGVAESDDPLIYVNGFSKSYAMTGWRLGYAAARGEAAKVMLRIHQALVTSVTSFVQHGAVAAFTQAAAVTDMRNAYARRLERVLSALQRAGLESPTPQGAFYVFPRVPAAWRDGDAFATYALEHHGVAVVPGSVFGDAHADSFRLCFACADDLLDEGLEALVRAVQDAGPRR
jgi:aspartate/methionine/tyrosine aminotransferase